MKNLCLILTLFTLAIVNGQSTSSKKYKVEYLQYPSLKASNISSINIKIYNGKSSINQDSLVSYSGTMNILTNYKMLRLGKFPGKSLNEITLVNNNASINIGIAFGVPEVIDMKAIKGTRATIVGDVLSYYYQIKYKFPTIVKISDKNGNILDIWSFSPFNDISYGNKKIVKRTNLKKAELLTYDTKLFKTEYQLESDYLLNGRYYVERKALILQLKKAIESIYNRIYFFEVNDAFKINSGKGRRYDYSELNTVQNGAINAIELKNYGQLNSYITIWKKYLNKANDTDKKAMINSKIKVGLLENLAIANMYLKNFKLAKDYADAFVKQATYNYKRTETNVLQVSNSLKSTDNVLYQAYSLRHLIKLRADAMENNGNLSVNFNNLNRGINLKKEIGRKDKNYKFNLFSNKDKFQLFLSELNAHLNNETKKRGGTLVNTNIPKLNPYNVKLEKVLGSKLKQLSLSIIDYPNLENKPFPKEIVELKNVGQIIMPNFGFTSLPNNFGNLNQLTSIVLPSNKLTALPESIANISNLKDVNFSYNSISNLSDSFFGLNNLEKLNLSNNKIERLSEKLGNLTSLQVLNLKNNKLKSLPETIKKCKKLKRLLLKGNNFNTVEINKIKSWLPNTKIKF